MSKENPITVNPTTGKDEDNFREQVRDILDLDWSTHDQKIFDELRRLKNVDTRVTALANGIR